MTTFFMMGCNQEKEVTLFQNSVITDVKTKSEVVFKKDDLLGISLFCEDKNLNELFNISVSGSGSTGGYSQGTPPPNGFLVDGEGFVNLPLMGKMMVAGKTKSEFTKELITKLSEYVKSPVVNVRILNFKVTVMGDVFRPGTIYIPSDRVTILDAIAIAGDLQITARRDNVLVVREIDGKRLEFRLDLNKSECLNSEAYYLQQNDVVYITPNKVKANTAAVNNANITLGLSAVSVVISFLILVTR